MNKKDKIPAIPPNDYEGSMADWITTLFEMGYQNADEYYDIYLTHEQYEELLTKCEES